MTKLKKTTINLPSEVYVIGHRYTIEALTELLFKEMEAYGDCCNEKKIIRIYCGVAESVIRDTMIHEILHAMWSLCYLEECNEENTVASLATAWIGFLDDPRNKKFNKIIMEGFNGKPAAKSG
jgi:hypothetical protein